MNKLVRVFMIALAIFASNKLNAQDISEFQEEIALGYRPQPYGFVQAQGGAGVTFTNASFTKLITPTYSLGVGKMFSDAVGARLYVNGYKSTGMLNTTAQREKYKFNYINTDVDLMLNLVNLFSAKKFNVFNVYLIGGIGLNYAWDNDELNNLSNRVQPTDDLSSMWGDNCQRSDNLGHNFRVGMLFDVNVHKHWSVGMEVDLNSLNDRFNSKHSKSCDKMLTAQIGVTYKFGIKKPRKPITSAKSAMADFTEEAVNEAVVASGPETTLSVVEPIYEVIYYVISGTTPTKEIIDHVVDWAKKNPGHTINISGYADKGTGTAAINAALAQKRAETVAAQLIEAGVPDTQVMVKSYGDTVQPFEENDKNRCVIISAK